MERLWAPWRIVYIEQAEDKEKGCIFCTKPAEERDRDNLILYRGETAFVMMNCFPYNPGHLMVAPFKHTADLYDLDDRELLEIQALTRYIIRVLREMMNPDGLNMGVNLGRTAGAGIVDHVHWHVVPRWNGDTNFMPVLADTKVLPEALESTYEKLRRKIDELGAP
jgi:ATP adenylyltransferase